MDCESIYIYPAYHIVVVNSSTGERICDAQVAVTGENTGMQPVSLSGCVYIAVIPNDSAVTISVTGDGFAPAKKTVSTRYETDECDHAIATEVRVDITPL